MPRRSQPKPETGQTRPAAFTCHICGGVLEEQASDGSGQPPCHCRLGHRFTMEQITEAQGETLRKALAAALRVLEEGVESARRVSEHYRTTGRPHTARLFERKRVRCRQDADAVRRLLGSEDVESLGCGRGRR